MRKSMETNFDLEERLKALMWCRDFHSREVSDYSERIRNFPKSEPEYEDMEEINE